MNKKFNNFGFIDNLKRYRGIFPTRLNKYRLDANERVSDFDIKFIKILKKKNIYFDFVDPYFDKIRKGRKILIEKKSIKLNKKNLKTYDCAIIVTDHDLFDYKFISKNFKLVFDCRGVFYSKKIFAKNIIQV